jgi:alpha/beta hydrolase fold
LVCFFDGDQLVSNRSVFPSGILPCWQIGLDPARIGIKGESGGGGFAAAAALYARDRQGKNSPFSI